MQVQTATFAPFSVEAIEQSLVARFEQQVEKYSERTAIKQGHHQLTYQQLNAAANRVAHTIVMHGGIDTASPTTAAPVVLSSSSKEPTLSPRCGVY